MRTEPFITYRHFKRKNGALTASCEVIPSKMEMTVGFAFCSPLDLTHFDKEKARNISTGRRVKRPVHVRLNGSGKGLGVASSLIQYVKNYQGDLSLFHLNNKLDANFKRWLPLFLQEL